MCAIRHGRRFALLGTVVALTCAAAAPAASPSTQRIPASNSRVIDINYASQTGGAVIERVELWYTLDGEQWLLHSQSHDPRPPIRFRAAQDGVHGFFVLLASAHGTSSRPPQPGEPPHQWVLVDTTRPLVQVKQVRFIPEQESAGATLAVVWTAHDDHFPERPVSIYYQLRERPGWQLMASNLANAGRFDWVLPANVFGEIEVRVSVLDRADNRSSDVSALIVVPQTQARLAASGTEVGQAAPIVPPERLDPLAPSGGEAEQRRRAHDLYERGVWRRQRGEVNLATQRLIESMNIDPQMAAPAFELAEIYYTEGRYDQAIDIYKLVLAQRADDRDALRGMALALVAGKNYPEALAAIERALIKDPKDAQSWMDAGDIFVWMGQSEQARRHWKKASEVAERGSEVKRNAELRLRNSNWQ